MVSLNGWQDKREGALTALRKDVSELKIRVGKLENTPGLDAVSSWTFVDLKFHQAIRKLTIL